MSPHARSRLPLALLTACLAVTHAPGVAAAQRRPPAAPAVSAAPAGPLAVAGAAVATARHPLAPADAARRATDALDDTGRGAGLSTVLYGGGGAIAGAFLGYFTSQLVRSDWQTGADRGAPPRRGWFLAGGAAVGMAGGILFDRYGPRALGGGRARAPRDRLASDVLTSEDLLETDAANLLELVRARRSHWLVKRGTHSFTRNPRVYDFSGSTPIVVPDDTPIVVYQDNIRLGGPEHLRDILPSQATRVEFLDVREATLRFGGGHTHGAIVVSTMLSDAGR